MAALRQAGPAALVRTFPGAALGLTRQETLVEEVAAQGRPVLLLWQSPPALIVGRADTRLPGFAAAATASEKAGWPVLVRRSGGLACPVSLGTLQLALARPVVPGVTIESAYRDLAALLLWLLAGHGLAGEVGEVPAAFCPGRYDIAVGGRKLAGLSQHWQRRAGIAAVTTAAALIVREPAARIAGAVDGFYAAAGGPPSGGAEAVAALADLLPPADAGRLTPWAVGVRLLRALVGDD